MESKFEEEGKAGEEKVADGAALTAKEMAKVDDGWVLPGAGEDSSVLVRAAQWFGKDKRKLQLLGDFAADAENHGIFADEVNGSQDDGTGFKLEYDACHKRYLALFEEQIEGFIADEGCSLEEFQRDCEEVRNGKSLTLFEHEDHAWFLEALMASLNYTDFHQKMVNAAKKHKFASKKKSKK